jgi:hypothetical protein
VGREMKNQVRYAVSTSGGERPVWRRDGKEIFYRENLRLMAVEVKAKGDIQWPDSIIRSGCPQHEWTLV